MDLDIFPSAADFLAVTRPVLQEAEPVNCLIYGLAVTLERFPERYNKLPYHWPPFLAAVIRSSGLSRAGLFITSKVSPEHLGYADVLRSCANSLRRLVEPRAIEPLIQVADTGSQKRTQLTTMPPSNCLSRCPDVRSPFSLFIRQKPGSFQDFPIRYRIPGLVLTPLSS